MYLAPHKVVIIVSKLILARTLILLISISIIIMIIIEICH